MCLSLIIKWSPRSGVADLPQEAFIFNRSNLTYAAAIMPLIQFYRLEYSRDIYDWCFLGPYDRYWLCRVLLKKSTFRPIFIDLQISADVPYDEAYL
jgi:hypothetical protein